MNKNFHSLYSTLSVVAALTACGLDPSEQVDLASQEQSLLSAQCTFTNQRGQVQECIDAHTACIQQDGANVEACADTLHSCFPTPPLVPGVSGGGSLAPPHHGGPGLPPPYVLPDGGFDSAFWPDAGVPQPRQHPHHSNCPPPLPPVLLADGGVIPASSETGPACEEPPHASRRRELRQPFPSQGRIQLCRDTFNDCVRTSGARVPTCTETALRCEHEAYGEAFTAACKDLLALCGAKLGAIAECARINSRCTEGVDALQAGDAQCRP